MFQRLVVALIAVLIAAFVGRGLDRNRAEILGAWERWRYPAAAAPKPSPLGGQILGELQDQRIKGVSHEFGRVRAEMDEARAKGFSVDRLEPTMTLALNWAKQGRYREALFLINSVEMRIPRKRESVNPAGAGEGFVSEQKEIEAAPVKAKKKKHKRARKGRQ